MKVRKARNKVRTKTATPKTVAYSVERNEPPSDILEHVIVWYGESGIGKTSVAAQIDNMFVIQCDPNRRGLAIAQFNVENLTHEEMKRTRPDMTPWETIEFVITDSLEKHPEIENYAIDNFGLFYEHCYRHVCFKANIDSPNEAEDFGVTWRKIETRMASILERIINADKGLVIITHDTEKEISLPSGDTIERIQPDVPKAAFKWIKACSNFAFYMHYNPDGERHIKIRSGMDVWTKCCTEPDEPRFHDPNGNPVETIPAGKSAKEAWENILKSWDNELHDVKFEEEQRKKLVRNKTKKKTRKTT